MRGFPVDAPKTEVTRALERLGFLMVREGTIFQWYGKIRTEAELR